MGKYESPKVRLVEMFLRYVDVRGEMLARQIAEEMTRKAQQEQQERTKQEDNPPSSGPGFK